LNEHLDASHPRSALGQVDLLLSLMCLDEHVATALAVGFDRRNYDWIISDNTCTRPVVKAPSALVSTLVNLITLGITYCHYRSAASPHHSSHSLDATPTPRLARLARGVAEPLPTKRPPRPPASIMHKAICYQDWHGWLRP
jgi:hypothetical protein